MEDKYKMTLEENIFVAKRNVVDSIWKSANLEGIAVTYPQIETIFQGLGIQNMKVKDINAIEKSFQSEDKSQLFLPDLQ